MSKKNYSTNIPTPKTIMEIDSMGEVNSTGSGYTNKTAHLKAPLEMMEYREE